MDEDQPTTPVQDDEQTNDEHPSDDASMSSSEPDINQPVLDENGDPVKIIEEEIDEAPPIVHEVDDGS